MPCCGGKDAGKPISAGRYAFGLFMLIATHGAILAAMSVLALFIPRYRRLLSSYLFYTRRTFKSVFARERIVVGTDRCAVPPSVR